MRIKIKFRSSGRHYNGGEERLFRDHKVSCNSRAQTFGYLENLPEIVKHYLKDETATVDDIFVTETVKKDGKRVEQLYTAAGYASSYCRRCGRALTDPQSVARGIGPECMKKHGSAATGKNSPSSGIAPLTAEGAASLPRARLGRCSCGEWVNYNKLQTYDHDGGMPVEGYEQPQWVYFECPECGQQTSWKLLFFPL